MKIKTVALVFAFFGIGFAAYLIAGPALQQQGADDPDLNKRISKLEAQVQALQKQVKELELKSRYKFLSIPESGVQQNQIPPGARRYNFNGQNIWLVPLSPDAKS